MTRLADRSDPKAWREALRRWSMVEQPQQRAYATIRLAEALLDAVGDRDEAVALLPIGRPDRVVDRRRTAAGGSPRDRRTGQAPLDGVAASVVTTPGGRTATLTQREQAVVRLVADGHTNREIGDQLFISEKTVSVHVSNAMAKLGALSRYEAAALAERQGLL